MSLNAATIAVLIEKGLSAADILEVAKATEAKADPTNAQRQARHRAKKRNGVTVTPLPPNDIYSNPRSPSSTSPEPNGSSEAEAPHPVSIGNGSAAAARLEPEHVLESWNELAERLGLARAERLTDARRRQLNARIRGSPDPVRDFTAAFDAIERSSFLRGENDRGWRADFDFVLQPKTFTKLIEGAYDH